MSLAFLFKQVYKPNEIIDLCAVGRPYMGLVPKNTAFGKNMTHNWEYARPAGISNTFTVSQNAQDNQSAGAQLITQPSQKYSVFRLDAKEAAASLKGDAYAYASTKKHELSKRIDDFYTQIDVDLHGAGNGIMATVSSISGTTLSLSQDSIMNRFMLGQKLINVTTFPTDGTVPTQGTASMTITGVNFSSRTITVDNVTGLSAGNWLAFPGDLLGFSSSNFYGNLIGRGAWVPTLDSQISSSDNFLQSGLNRNSDFNRLTGTRTQANGLTATDAILLNAALVYELGGKPDKVFMHPTDWQRMAINLQTQARYDTSKANARVSYKTITLAGPSGSELSFYSDPHQQKGTARVDTMDSWELGSVGELVDLADDDGLQALRDANADAFQIRIRSYPQLRCFDPHANGVVTGI